MATLIACADGNFTSSSTWATGASELDSQANNFDVTTTPTDGSNFTPGAITVDGILVKLRTRAASPTGTFTVALRNTTDSTTAATVTVNVSDLPANALDDASSPLMNGWMLFQFSSVLLTAGKNYAIRLSTSSASQVNLWRDATASNPSRILRTTTTAAPGAGDKLIITKEMTAAATSTSRTVTMDNTASTTFGAVSATAQSLVIAHGGTLIYGTSASTNYLLTIAGLVQICRGGTLSIGTSGTRIPSTSTAKLAFDLTASVDSGLLVNGGGTLNMYGHNGRTPFSTLTADAASGQPVVTVASTSGWANTDDVVLAPTSRTATETDLRVISSVDSATQITVTSNLTNAHKGSSPIRGHIINLTRNVMLWGESDSLRAYVVLYDGALCNVSYVHHKWLGASAGVSNTSCAYAVWNTASSGVDIQNSSFQSCARCLTGRSTTLNGVVFSYNVGYLLDREGVIFNEDTTNTSWTITNNVLVRNANGLNMYHLNSLNGTFTDNVASAASGYGFALDEDALTAAGTVGNLEAYACGNGGYLFTSLPHRMSFTGTISAWRNAGSGITFSGAFFFPVMSTVVTFGNNGSGILVQSGICKLRFLGWTSGSDASFTQSYGFRISISGEYIVENSDLGVAAGIYTAHGTADVSVNSGLVSDVHLNHVALGHGTTKIENTGNYSKVRCTNYNKTAGDHRTFFSLASTTLASAESWQTDTTIYNAASPSLRVTPKSALYKFESPVVLRCAIASGATATPSITVRKSAAGDGTAYTGNQPRLIVKSNPAIGITADTVLDTMSVGTGSWETLTGTTAAVTADGVLEFVIDCDGSAGWINIDDAAVS